MTAINAVEYIEDEIKLVMVDKVKKAETGVSAIRYIPNVHIYLAEDLGCVKMISSLNGECRYYVGKACDFDPQEWSNYEVAGDTPENYRLKPLNVVVPQNEVFGKSLVMTGVSIDGEIPVLITRYMSDVYVYLAEDGDYTKMVSSFNGECRYYAGTITDFNPVEWTSYLPAGNEGRPGNYSVRLKRELLPEIPEIEREGIGIVMFGHWVNGKVPVIAIRHSIDDIPIYIAQDGDCVKMVSLLNGECRYFMGNGEDFNFKEWSNYAIAPGNYRLQPKNVDVPEDERYGSNVVMVGASIQGEISIAAVRKLGNEATVYLAEEDGYTRMVSSFNGECRYYAGRAKEFNPSKWNYYEIAGRIGMPGDYTVRLKRREDPVASQIVETNILMVGPWMNCDCDVPVISIQDIDIPIYLAEDAGFVRMVSSFNGECRYYQGVIEDFNPGEWANYAVAGSKGLPGIYHLRRGSITNRVANRVANRVTNSVQNQQNPTSQSCCLT